MACAARPGAEAAFVRKPPAAVLQAGTQVAADAVAELPRARARAEGRRLRGVRVARRSLLPRPQIPDTDSALRPLAGRGGRDHACDLRVPVVRRRARDADRERVLPVRPGPHGEAG